MFIKVVNSIPRIVFPYKSASTNGQLIYKQFAFPCRPSTFFNLIRSQFLGVKKEHKEELGILHSHDEIYEKNDVILAIGLGNGISLIHNCAKPRKRKSFIGIEASCDQIEIAKSNAKLNGIDPSKFEIIEGYVGNPTNVYGNCQQQSKKVIDINRFEFDILELDCEGSEVEILRNLSARPRHIIVEMHPMFRDINIDKFLDDMKSKGYYLGKIFTDNGELVNFKDLDNYFSLKFVQKIIKKEINLGDGLLILNFSLK